MKKIGAICLVLCYMIMSFCCATVAAVEPELENQQVFGCHSVDAANAFLGSGKIVDNAEAIFLYETKSQTLMYEMNADAKMDPASLVKIMTAYVAVEKGNLDDIVTVDAETLASLPTDVLSADLVDGEMLTLRDLLYCMLIGSANDACNVIADHISGSQTQFVEDMNEMAAEIGCSNTNFTNATGLYDENQVISARDTVRIIEAALQNDQFREIFCSGSYTVPATNKSDERFLATNNYLMIENEDKVTYYVDGRVTGGRTGSTRDGKRVVASVSEFETMELICVVMGSESEVSEKGNYISVFGGYQETTALLDAGFNNLKVAQVLYGNQALSQHNVINGECDVVLGSQVSVYALLSKNTKPENLTYRYSHAGQGLEAPIEKGQLVSSVEIWSGGICVAQADLYAMNSVSVKQDQPIDDASRTADGISFKSVILTVVIFVGAFIVLIYCARRVQYIIFKRRKQRNRHNRRRST